MKILKTVTFAAILFTATPALAFDDNRQGFILGLGVGSHSLGIDWIYNGRNFGSQAKSGLATSFKIGAGITDQFALYYVRNASWYNAPYFDGYTTTDTTFTMGLSGLGASYFLAPTTPSAYFLAALGSGDLSLPFKSNSTRETGGASMFGVGYEFSRHIMAEGTILNTKIISTDDSRLSIKSTSFQFEINYLFY